MVNCNCNAPKKIINNKSFLKSISGYFVEFCNNTTIQGFKFLVESERCVLERLWWLTVLFMCFFICGNLMLNTLSKWKRSPVFISYSKQPFHVWDVPFPAITVCPENRILNSKYNFHDYLSKVSESNVTDGEVKKFRDISLVCKREFLFEEPLQSDHDTTFNNIIENAPSREDFLIFLATNMPKKIDESSFSPIFTEFGLCFSFNMLDRNTLFSNITYLPEGHAKHQNTSHWSLNDNYERTTSETFPIRMSSIADYIALDLRTRPSDINVACDLHAGYIIKLHHPAEIPIGLPSYIPVNNDDIYKIQITAEMTLTTSELNSYDPLKRKCYFSQEKKLLFFRIYTERNCKVECLANYTLHACGCVRYYMPHNSSTKLCFSTSMCTRNVKQRMLQENFASAMLGSSSEGNGLSCNCLPSCTSIVYTGEFQKQNPHLYKVDASIETVNNVMVGFSFKEESIVTKERDELYSMTDFWANCGGILGLFIGFSVISLAEIIYFCSLRWICNLWKLFKGFHNLLN